MRLLARRNLKLNIQGQPVSATLRIDQYKHDSRVVVSCPTSVGIDLVSFLNLNFTQTLVINKRLRNEAKKRQALQVQLDAILDAYQSRIESEDIKLYRQIVKVRPLSFSPECFLSNGSILPYSSIKSLGMPQRLSFVSWHTHDLYKDEIKYLVQTFETELDLFDRPQRRVQWYLPDSMLYDLKKVRALSERSEFKSRNFSFFNYDKVYQLLGLNHGGGGMSGLFAS